MLYIFNLDEQLVAVLENKDGEACSLESVKLKENLTGEFSLEFEIPTKHDDMQYILERYYVAVEDTDGTMQLFIIAEIKDTHAERMTKTVYCDHASIEMNDEIIEEVVISKENSSSAFGAIMAGSKWTIGASDATVSTFDLTARMKPRRNVLVTFAERWGVELAYRVTLANNSIGERIVDMKLERGSRKGKRLEYTKDLEEITRTVNADFLKTALYGVGQKYDPPTAAKEEDVPDEEKLQTNFVGVDWSTESRVVVRNLLRGYQANPSSNRHLKGLTKTGSLKAEKDNSVPAGVGGTRSYKVTQLQTASAALSITTNKQRTFVFDDTQYAASVYAKCSKSAIVRFYVRYYNHAKKVITYVSDSTTIAANTWYRFTKAFTTPHYTHSIELELRLEQAALNDSLYWACAQIELGDAATPWTLHTRSGTNPFNKPAGQGWIGNDAAKAKWGRLNKVTGQREHVFGVFEDSGINDPQELLLATKAALDQYAEPQISYEAKEIALGEILNYDHEKIFMGDTIYVIDRDFGWELETRCIERQVDLLNKEESDYVFGNFIKALSKSQIDAIEKLQNNMDNAPPPTLPLDYLDEGSVIQTDWLEGKISALQNQVEAGGGTVTITEDDGILIEDITKTKAIRLLGGMLALANERDQGTGLYNWRSFGTGDGFLADLVETGFIQWTRAKGGQLTLGGEIMGYEVGQSVLTITMDGKVKGDADTTRIIKYANPTYEVQPASFTLEVNAGYANVSYDDAAFMSWYATGAWQYVQYLVEITLPTVELLEQLEIRVKGKAGMPFTLRPYRTSDWTWDTSKTVTFTGAADDFVSLVLDDITNYQSGNIVRFSIMTTTALGAGGGYLSLDINYLEIFATYTDLLEKPIYQNGTMTVLDSEGKEVVQLTGDKGGFDNLFVGVLTGENVVTKNYQGDLNYFVNVVTGSDLNDGSEANPFLTIQKALDTIPNINNDTIIIQVVNTATTFVESIVVDGKMGSGKIGIGIGNSNVMKGEVSILKCTNEINIATDQSSTVSTAATSTARAEIQNQNLTGYLGVIYAFFSNYVYVTDIVCNSNNLCNYGIYAYGSYVRNKYVEVYNAITSCIVGAYGARVDIDECVGQSTRGVYGTGSAQFGGTGKAPTGTTYNVYMISGAQSTSTWTHTAGLAKTIAAAKKTTTWTANDTKSYSTTAGWASDFVYQGKRPGENGNWYGIFYFNTRDFAVLKNGDLSLRPISKVRLKIQRTNNTGENTYRKPKVYYNMQTATSGAIQTLKGGTVNATSFSWGQEKWITLPNSIGQAFQNGTAKSIVLYYGSDLSNYMRFEQKATLEITHG